MTYEAKPNTGSLFKNDKGDNPKRPDYRGSLNVNGVDGWLSAWLKESKDGGKKYMSLSWEAKEQQQSAAPSAPAQSSTKRAPPKPTPADDSFDDSAIPF